MVRVNDGRTKDRTPIQILTQRINQRVAQPKWQLLLLDRKLQALLKTVQYEGPTPVLPSPHHLQP